MEVKVPDGIGGFKAGERCDSCGKIAVMFDRFKAFSIPRVAKASTPMVPEKLHACPACERKVKAAVKNRDASFLPPGPLRKVLERIATKDKLRSLKIY
jgi:hypothetical protein